MNTIFGTIEGLSPALGYHMARQNLIAANIANVDTPGYIAKELVRPVSASESRIEKGLDTTDLRHIQGNYGSGGGDFEVLEEGDAVAGNDLNRVSMEREMSRLAANTLKYEAVGRIIAKQIGILKYAVSNASRS